MRILIFLVVFLCLASCKNDSKVSDQVNPADLLIKPDNSVPTDPKKLSIPSACEMISEAKVQAFLNIQNVGVEIKPADDPGNVSAKSCFFKWDDANTANAGILIQIQTNPVYDEYPEYVSNFVSSKLTEGETVLGNNTPTKFKKFSAGNTVGAYSFDQSRFYWNLGNDYLFMLAFNVSTLNESKMVDIAKEIVAEVNNNFASKVKK